MTKATRPGRQPSPTPMTDGDRICAHPGCRTRLSKYNTDQRCWQHADIVFSTLRGKRLRRGGS